MNVNIGHRHPAVIQAIKDQADRLPFVAPPLCIDADQIAERLSVINSALQIADDAIAGPDPT